MAVDNGIYILDKFLGLNRLGEQYNMSPEWIWDLLNGYIENTSDGRGAIQQRNGITKYNTTILNDASTKIRFMKETNFAGTKTIIIRGYDGWYRYNAGSFTGIDTSRTVDNKGFAVMWGDGAPTVHYLIMVDGGTPRKATSSWTVSNISSDAAMPTDSTAVHVHQKRLWLNSASKPMKIYGSKVGDATGASAWSTSSDSIAIDLEQVLPEGDEVVGFGTIGELLLIVFLKKQIAIYNAPTTFSSISIVQIINIGCETQNGIYPIGGDLIYVSNSGLKSLISSQTTGHLNLKDISKNIDPLYREYFKNEIDPRSICGTYFNNLNHLYFSIHNTSITTQTLIYSSELGQIVGRWNFLKNSNGEQLNPYSWLEARDGTLYIGMDNGFVYKYDKTTNTDDGINIPFSYIPPLLGAFSQTFYKAPREFEILVESDAVIAFNLDYWFGLGETSPNTEILNMNVSGSFWDDAAWDTSLWDVEGRELILNHNLIGRGRNIGLKIRNLSSSRIRILYMILKTILEGYK